MVKKTQILFKQTELDVQKTQIDGQRDPYTTGQVMKMVTWDPYYHPMGLDHPCGIDYDGRSGGEIGRSKL